jgi:CheY-like chemotaxis protein
VAQVLLNLLLNAVAFSPAGGTVTLGLGETDGAVVFRVTDEGPGIDPERAAALFVAPESTRPGGTGIGPGACGGCGARAGRRAGAGPTRPGRVLRAVVAQARRPRPPRAPPPNPSALEGVRVLVLEDDPAVLGLIELALEARGASVIAITSRHDLGSFDAAGPLSVALFDLSPIADDPRAALATLRARAGDVPVVLISGSPNGAAELSDADVCAWIRKPFEMGEVIEILRGLLVRAP